MKLSEYIERYHNGNKSEFARVEGIDRTQVNRYIKLKCIWYDGSPWQRKIRKKQIKTNKEADKK